jgi:hypothetical protein
MHLPLSSFLERKKVSPHQEIPQSHPPAVQELHKPTHLQAQVLWGLQWWPVLHPPQHQNHPGGVPVLPRANCQEASDGHWDLHLSYQLSSEQWGLPAGAGAEVQQRGNVNVSLKKHTYRDNCTCCMNTIKWTQEKQWRTITVFLSPLYFSVIIWSHLYLSFLLKDIPIISLESS